MAKLGFIGMGNMALALTAGFIETEALKPQEIAAFAPHQDKLKKNAGCLGFVPCTSLQELTQSSEVLVMACKPVQVEGVLKELGGSLSGKALLSIASGWDFEAYAKHLPQGARLQLIIPNIPVKVHEGVLLFEDKNSLTEEEHAWAVKLFSSIGKIVEIPSDQMDIAGAITGCAPAFVDLFIEAYADVAVKYGVNRGQAYTLVSQMIEGSAALQLATGEHPAALKDEVCSPGGTTIRGVCALEEHGFRAACEASIDAIMNS
ncbi:MAG: pyrroline-5-carboxylate reductase [Coriobacteriaceae bacterium]|jgi:pyrroline-5-carboxylate reductase|nr:MAG: pyrroline-5-carboxylate reductase [Coriobacteriaceae bacterium]